MTFFSILVDTFVLVQFFIFMYQINGSLSHPTKYVAFLQFRPTRLNHVSHHTISNVKTDNGLTKRCQTIRSPYNNNRELRGMVTGQQIHDDSIDDTFGSPLLQNNDNHQFFENAVLNQKLQGLHLSEQKLLVLQDAAKRMVKNHEAKMLEAQAQHSSTIVAMEQEFKKQQQQQIKNATNILERKYHDLDLKRIKAMNELNLLRETYREKLDVQRTEAARFLELQNDRHERERMVWSSTEDRLRKELNKMMFDHMKSISRANATIASLQTQLQEECENHSKWKAECAKITDRYNPAKIRLDRLRVKNEELLLSQAASNEALVMLQENYTEQMEIANAAVAAAHRREKSLQDRYENSLNENKVLQQLLDQRKMKPNKITMPSIGNVSNDKNNPNTDATSQLKNGDSRLSTILRWIKCVLFPRFPLRIFRQRKKESNC